MGQNCDSISVENVSCEAVKSVLNKEVGINIQEDKPYQVMGINIDVQDYKNEFQYARDFLNDNGLQEESPFYREFDMKDFNVVVDLCSQSGRACSDLKPVMADQFGKYISLILKTRVVVAFENGEIPFCIYENGIKAKDLKEYYETYFATKDWHPKDIISNSGDK